MSVLLTVSIQDEGVKNLLQTLRHRVKDLRPAMHSIGRIVRNSVVDNFLMEEAPSGRGWVPSRRAIKDRGRTLADTGRLQNSINIRVYADSVDVGTNVKYAGIHQIGGRVSGTFKVRSHFRTITQAFGKPIASTRVKVKAHSRDVNFNMPARPFLGVRNSDWPKIRQSILGHLLERA